MGPLRWAQNPSIGPWRSPPAAPCIVLGDRLPVPDDMVVMHEACVEVYHLVTSTKQIHMNNSGEP
eukprot:2851569-Karenia_brevis.AAC.1